MARPCSICGHPARAAIDAALRGGVSVRRLVQQYALARMTLRTHRSQHIAPVAPVDVPVAPPVAQPVALRPPVSPRPMPPAQLAPPPVPAPFTLVPSEEALRQYYRQQQAWQDSRR